MRTVGEVCLLTADVRRLSAFCRMLLGIESTDVDCMHQTLPERETMLTVNAERFSPSRLRPKHRAGLHGG